MRLPKTPKGLDSRIRRIRTHLSAFKREYGCMDDGGGYRYELFYLYYLLGDNRRSSEYLRWFQKEFPRDIGEPFMLLCWALMLHRMGKNADNIFIRAMVSNIYLLPHILGLPETYPDIQWLSNYAEADYLEYFPEQVRVAITQEERDWIRERYETETFTTARKRYIEIVTELQHTPPGEKRSALVDEMYGYYSPE